MAAMGLLCGYTLMMKRARLYSLDKNAVSDLVFCAMAAALVGARGLYVIRFWNEEFAGRGFSDIFKIYQGGLVFFGGFACAGICVIVFSRLRRLPLGDVGDLFAAALPLGHALGRIGCLLNGCCHGFEYHGPLAFSYNYLPQPTFPLQFFAALGNGLICIALLVLERKRLFRGRLFFCYLVMYSIGRFLIEFGRGDYPEGQLWHGLTPAQVTCLWLLPATLAVYAAVEIMHGRRGGGERPERIGNGKHSKH